MGGRLIDNVVHFAFFLALAAAICILSGKQEDVTRVFSQDVPYWILGVAAFSADFLIIAVNVYLWHTRGQSIGKMLVGTKIVKFNGERADLECIIGFRVIPFLLLSWVPVLGILGSLADALFIFQKEKTCLHDHFADTRVVNANVPVSV